MLDPALTCSTYKILSSFKRGEESVVEVKSTFLPEHDQEIIKLFDESKEYDQSKPVFFKIKMTRLVKIEDWFKDGNTIVKNLRKGRGRAPFIDSVVKFRMQILVNDKIIVNNYPEKDPYVDVAYDFHESENLKVITKEQQAEYLKKIEDEIYTNKLDDYELPSLITKIIKTMKKNGVVEVTTTRIDKLMSNFENEKIGLNQHE